MPMLTVPTDQLLSFEIAARRAALAAEHDDLDCAISALLIAGTCDDLLVKRLKKRKLHLKDEIALLLPVAEARSIAG